MVKAVTTLTVTLNDQTLIAPEKVKLASGDIESVFLKAEFDDAWAEFAARSASFYTSHDSTPHEVLLIDNQCTIPPEVLAKPGTLYVGIVGVTADGSAMKTSTEVSYKISKGASHAYTTLTPEMDMYQQYLAAVMKAVSPAQDVLLARLEERIAQHEVEISEEYARFKGALVEMIRPVTAWENNDVTNKKWYGSSTNTVNVDLSNYSSFLVVFYEKGKISGSEYSVYPTLVGSPMIVEKGVTYRMEIRNDNSEVVGRNFTITDNGVEFGGTNYYCLIPAKIIGFGC